MLPASAPTVSVLTVRRGQSGWFVYALQRALNTLAGASLGVDGVFGPATEAAVEKFQSHEGLPYVDGLAGPQTQGKLGTRAVGVSEGSHAGAPKGLLHGLTMLESGNMLSVVNAAVAGGVDCGLTQMRCYGPPFDQAALKTAFSPLDSCDRALTVLIDQRDGFISHTWAKGSRERAGRCAALAHNWPAGASYYAEHGHAPDAQAKCTWVPRDANGVSRVRFPDGAAVETRQDWCEFYALGGRHGEGAASRFVTSW